VLLAEANALVQVADVVLLACKPQDAEAALSALRWPEAPRALISMAAGLTHHWLKARVPKHVQVARVMPNVAAQVGAGITGVLRCEDPALQAQVESIFAACGEVVVLEKEQLFNAMTAISGSGPAYLFLIMEALADGGVKLGLSREIAQKLAVETVRGAAELVARTGEHPARLREQVASPGGMTIAGLGALEDAGVRGAMMRAVEAAARRGDQLAGG
jgi:pyrroline-5-carboxylate reductase